MNSVGKILLSAAVPLVAGAACYMPFVAADALKNYEDSCEYLIILGGKTQGGDQPGEQLHLRIERAAEYLAAHPQVKAVASGACFRRGQTLSEAAIIERELVKLGIDSERIILDEDATTTYENFKNAFSLIEGDCGKPIDEVRLAVLSNSYHLHRAGVIAADCGKKGIGMVTAPTPKGDLACWVREFFVAFEILAKKLKIKS